MTFHYMHAQKTEEGASFDDLVERLAPVVRMKLGASIAHLRNGLGLTQEELSESVGMKRSSLARIEMGGSNASMAMILRICIGLNVQPSELMKCFDVEAM